MPRGTSKVLLKSTKVLYISATSSSISSSDIIILLAILSMTIKVTDSSSFHRPCFSSSPTSLQYSDVRFLLYGEASSRELLFSLGPLASFPFAQLVHRHLSVHCFPCLWHGQPRFRLLGSGGRQCGFSRSAWPQEHGLSEKTIDAFLHLFVQRHFGLQLVFNAKQGQFVFAHEEASSLRLHWQTDSKWIVWRYNHYSSFTNFFCIGE